MANHPPLVCPSQYPLYQDVLMTLVTLTPRPLEGHVLPSQDTWVKTRQIADAHNISIYRARLLLLGLVEIGLAIVSDGPVKKSLRWYPHSPTV
ncbi:FaeA/PapI family transcriptional regulator [Serratia plymuthica]|uniref:FaeA/PapI family transcriptional regulator n=1 Tax=Serratia plymuthica TaxID=82996 RepID=UPI000935AB1E|nr:hypothetical protein BSR04_05345 [Serratia plymuthica]